MIIDYYGFLSHNFTVADLSSMRHSQELRVPLATYRLFDLAMHMSDDKLIRFRTTKILLKQMLVQFLPKSLIFRKKTGFNPPLDTYINGIGEDKLYSILLKNRLFDYLNEKIIRGIIQKHYSSKKNYTYELYTLLNLSYRIKYYGVD